MKTKVFIVEDESLLALDVKKYLEYNEYEVVGIADRGQDALRQLRESPADVVLMDIRIKGKMDGIETAEIVQKEMGIPVIYVTAYTEDVTLDRAKRTSPYGFVVKPFSRRELVTSIEMALFKSSMEKELQARERRYSSLFNHSNDAILITDLSGCILESNIKARTMMGYSEDELEKMHFLDLIDFTTGDIDDDVFSYDEMKSELNEQGAVRREVRFVTKKRRIIWIDLGTNIVDEKEGLVQSILRDITERKQVENKLIRFSMAVNQSPSLIMILDRDGYVEYVNPQYIQTLGYKKKELLEKDFRGFITDPHELDLNNALWKEVLEGKVWRGEMAGKKKSSEVYHETVSFSPIKNNKGRITHVLRVGVDITERKNSEAEREKLEKQLRHSQKLETIGRLAGGIAHDFNNILAPIAVYADMALDDIPEESHSRSDLNHVLVGVTRAKDLVQQILRFSRQDEQNHKPLMLHLVVKEALNLIRASIPSTVLFTLNLDKNAGCVVADPTQIHQIVMNLCTNGFQALPSGGGTLTVSLKPVEITEMKHDGFARLKPGSYVLLSVSDSGCGIERDVLDRVFEPFFTTKVVGKNSGLGLSVVHGIVKRHQGEITIESSPGNGTEVRIYFPVCPECETGSLPEEEGIPGGSESILFVDDEEENASMGQEMLSRLGYLVTVMRNGKDAWKEFESRPDEFDLVITDQSMPGMPGTDLAKKITDRIHDIPVILVTGFSEDLADDFLEKTGIVKIIKKPMIRKELAREIRSQLDRRKEAHAD